MSDAKELLVHTLNQKPSEFTDVFNDLLLNKIQTAVANKKVEVAQNMFNPTEPDYEEVEDEQPEEIETDA